MSKKESLTVGQQIALEGARKCISFLPEFLRLPLFQLLDELLSRDEIPVSRITAKNRGFSDVFDLVETQTSEEKRRTKIEKYLRDLVFSTLNSNELKQTVEQLLKIPKNEGTTVKSMETSNYTFRKGNATVEIEERVIRQRKLKVINGVINFPGFVNADAKKTYHGFRSFKEVHGVLTVIIMDIHGETSIRLQFTVSDGVSNLMEGNHNSTVSVTDINPTTLNELISHTFVDAATRYLSPHDGNINL